MVNAVIDGKKVSVPENTPILEAARAAGIDIPTLCYYKDLNDIGACRVCVVEAEGCERLLTACNNAVEDGMVIHTDSPKARKARRMNVELILSRHDSSCTTCVRSGNCKLQSLANDLNITSVPFEKELPPAGGASVFPLQRDSSKCIKCFRCVQVCDKIQSVNIWDMTEQGPRADVGVSRAYSLEESDCALCGQCITHCPVGALYERDDTEKVLSAIDDPEKTVMFQIAPSIRTAWGEYFGLSADTADEQLLAAVLRRMGADYVFDTNFAADLTIMEEGSEFVEKLKRPEGEKFPLFTSCCPGWVRFLKAHYPEFTDNLSTAKSPQQMFGAVAKSYWAELTGTDPHNIFCVSVMPCVAKKHECALGSMNDACGDADVDVSLTTRELVRMIRAARIDPSAMEKQPLDRPLGTYTGAGNIFGASGGVMEAALRSAHFLVTGEDPDPDMFSEVRGMEGVKERVYDIAGRKIRTAVVNGLGNADKLLGALKSGKANYDFVEVMACPGGCVGGGGQPIHEGEFMAAKRAPVLYRQDKASSLRFSHKNPDVAKLYSDYLERPLSEKSHHLLHTDHHAWDMPV
ncbi:MAG: iron hydrogenase small subunit [Oscillospiraceae bacterium]|nr:iron hydrogenase small subunit [Oscillospiraceae bacterium]